MIICIADLHGRAPETQWAVSIEPRLACLCRVLWHALCVLVQENHEYDVDDTLRAMNVHQVVHAHG